MKNSQRASLACVGFLTFASWAKAEPLTAQNTDAAGSPEPVAPAAAAAEPAPTTPEAVKVSPPSQPGDASLEPSAEKAQAPSELPDIEQASDGAAESSSAEAPKLEFYGFADFNYAQMTVPKNNVWRNAIVPFSTFYAGHLNLYMGSSLSEDWRSLAEVRFTYAPIGNEVAQSDATFKAADTTADDVGEVGRTLQWSGIEIQRVWLEYQPLDFLTIRGGQWFTPYGFWNDDHGSPTIITVHKPFPINSQLFPERQTGLEAYGKFFVGEATIGYFLTLSNGRGPFDAVRDLDNNKAIGGRLFLDTRLGGALTVGVSAYRGRSTASQRRYRVDTIDGQPTSVLYRARTEASTEFSLELDARFIWRGLHLQGEAMMNEVAFADPYRPHPRSLTPSSTYKASYRDLGAYGLVGYRTPFLNVMPYFLLEYGAFKWDAATPPVVAWTGGVNIRPTASVVLKVEFNHGSFQDRGSTGLGGSFSLIETQAAWAF